MRLMRTVAMVLVLSALLLGLAPATLTAQEKMADSRVQVTTKVEIVRPDDVEGHMLVVFENRGYNLKTGSWTVNRGTQDMIKGTGTGRGYTTTTYPDGAITYGSWEGQSTTTMVDGKPVSTWSGTWKILSGTGVWTDREAGGTFKTKSVGDGVNLVDWAGEWRPKR